MRIVCLLACLSVASPANAGEQPSAITEAKALLADKDVARRAAGVAALGKIGSRAALEALLPVLEDRELIGRRYRASPVLAAFVKCKNRAVAISVLDSALLRPDIAVGGAWLFARAALNRTAGYGRLFEGPAPMEWGPPSDAERTKLLDRLASALPVKRAAVVSDTLHILVVFDHRSPHIAPAVARAWTELDRCTQVNLLRDAGWPLIRSDVVAAVLPRTPHSKHAASWYGDDPRSLALKRLVELGSAAARAEILADMRRPKPRLSRDALLALADERLPELEAVWHALLSKRQSGDPAKLAHLAERSAGSALLGVLLARYRESENWACEFNAAALRCILKWDTETGITEVRKALTRRGREHTGCYRDLLNEVLPRHWSAQAEALALANLDDKERCVRMSAALALTAAGSNRSAPPVLAFFATLRADDPAEGVLRFQLLFALTEREAWMADAGIKEPLYAQLSESDLGMLR